MRHPMRTRAAVTTCVLVAGLGALSGCGDAGTPAADKDGTSGSGHGTTTAEPSASTTPVSQGLPDGFPKDQVPLLDEKVLSGVKGAAGGPFAWSVVMASQRAIDDLSKEVGKDFASAGYTAVRTNELGDVSIHQFKNDTYDVGVTIARTGDGITITYLVKDKA